MKPFSIKALHPSGYSITFHIEPEDGKLHTIIAQLNRYGFRPDVSGDTWMRTPEGLPICPRHGVAMSKREKQGDTWYSHPTLDKTTGEKLYCRGYHTKNGSGFDLPATSSSQPNGSHPPPPNGNQLPPPPEPPPIQSPPQPEGTTFNNNSKLTAVPPPPEPPPPPEGATFNNNNSKLTAVPPPPKPPPPPPPNYSFTQANNDLFAN